MRPRRRAPLPGAILAGGQEGAFDRLPETVIANLRRPQSENARLWNTFYPRPGSAFHLSSLLRVKPLWGQSPEPRADELLEPYFWGFNTVGESLPGLKQTLDEVDGPGPRTEIDLVLLGPASLVVVEAKNLSALGRCGRYQRRVCPEVHLSADRWLDRCRYWDLPMARFDQLLEFGPRPGPGAPLPACAQHYQLARTLLVGDALAHRHALRLHLWVLLPRDRWSVLERTWLDFAERVRDPELWRRLRVMGWEDLLSAR
jgi:Restriction Endonuclease associating with ARP